MDVVSDGVGDEVVDGVLVALIDGSIDVERSPLVATLLSSPDAWPSLSLPFLFFFRVCQISLCLCPCTLCVV